VIHIRTPPYSQKLGYFVNMLSKFMLVFTNFASQIKKQPFFNLSFHIFRQIPPSLPCYTAQQRGGDFVLLDIKRVRGKLSVYAELFGWTFYFAV
jgi:hypothetical protein